MCFFKKKKNVEVNKINDENLKAKLKQTALNMLFASGDLTKDAKVEFKFGYAFQLANKDLEVLFKVIADKKIYYFAVQKNKFMKLGLNEFMYEIAVDTFLSVHNKNN